MNSNLLKSLIFSFLILCSFYSYAQLPDGSFAPDFTLTDIDGNTHTLYDYLGDGIPVIIEFSAVWCAPCWNYVQDGFLESLWSTHGFSATGDSTVMILFIEGDQGTLAQLQGGAGSQGDWTAEISFPIIQGPTSITSDFGIAYWPTIYTICPDGSISESGQIGDIEHLLYIDDNCCEEYGVNNASIYPGDDANFCEDYEAEFRIKNLGSAPLTSAEIEYSVNGVLVETISWTGNLLTYEHELVSASPISSAGDLNTSFEITAVNGATDDDPSNNVDSVDVFAPLQSLTQVVEIELYTDEFGPETSWEILDDAGILYASGGGYSDLSFYSETIILPIGGCYNLYVFDTWGDGFQMGSYLNLNDEFGNTLISVVGSFDETNDFFYVNHTAYEVAIYPFFDMDGDGVYVDSIDFILQNQYFINTEGLNYYLDGTGIGHFFTDSIGTFDIIYNSDGTWLSTPTNATVTIDSTQAEYVLYFELEAGTVQGDVTIDMTSGINRCFWEVPFWVTVTNENTALESGVVEVLLTDSVSLASSVPPADSIVGNIVYYSYENLLPTYSETFDLVLQMPGVAMMGDTIVISGSTHDDTDSLANELVCSYDPNDKLVEPKGEGEEAFTSFTDSLLTYTIRFQNTGTDTAFNIVVSDTISDLLDMATFKFLSSSHTCQTTIDQTERLVEFTFENILLPDSGVNQPGSNGFIKFQIEIEEGLAEGTPIGNTAYIYFDFNPAIITNTTLNTFATPPFFTSVPDIIEPEFNIFPNPARDIVNIESEFNYSFIEVYSMTGKRLLYKNDDLSSFSVDDLANGTYVVKFSDGYSSYVERFVVLK